MTTSAEVRELAKTIALGRWCRDIDGEELLAASLYAYAAILDVAENGVSDEVVTAALSAADAHWESLNPHMFAARPDYDEDDISAVRAALNAALRELVKP